MVSIGDCRMDRVSSAENTADPLTKPMSQRCGVDNLEDLSIEVSVKEKSTEKRRTTYTQRDDTLLFCQATSEAMVRIQLILKTFEQASGLQINMQKSAVMFSKNMNQRLKEDLARQLGVELVDKHEKYLGLPTVCGRSKRELFYSLKSRVWGRMQSYGAKRLSQAGRLVLIKVIAKAIP
ncbi:UNVERIFIED_CONTAM: hypothetical protein Sradi_4407400, partial [Sesamum radiatum]